MEKKNELKKLHFEEALYLGDSLTFSEDNSRPTVPSWNLPFWGEPDLNVRYLWIFQVDHTFYKLNVKILATRNKISCSWLSSSWWTVSTKALVLALVKEVPEAIKNQYSLILLNHEKCCGIK